MHTRCVLRALTSASVVYCVCTSSSSGNVSLRRESRRRGYFFVMQTSTTHARLFMNGRTSYLAASSWLVLSFVMCPKRRKRCLQKQHSFDGERDLETGIGKCLFIFFQVHGWHACHVWKVNSQTNFCMFGVPNTDGVQPTTNWINNRCLPPIHYLEPSL